MSSHHLGNNAGDSWKRNGALEKSCHRDFIGGIKDCGHIAASLQGLVGQPQTWKTFQIRRFEIELAHLKKVQGGQTLKAIARDKPEHN